jgi:hypothetical protein
MAPRRTFPRTSSVRAQRGQKRHTHACAGVFVGHVRLGGKPCRCSRGTHSACASTIFCNQSARVCLPRLPGVLPADGVGDPAAPVAFGDQQVQWGVEQADEGDQSLPDPQLFQGAQQPDRTHDHTHAAEAAATVAASVVAAPVAAAAVAALGVPHGGAVVAPSGHGVPLSGHGDGSPHGDGSVVGAVHGGPSVAGSVNSSGSVVHRPAAGAGAGQVDASPHPDSAQSGAVDDGNDDGDDGEGDGDGLSGMSEGEGAGGEGLSVEDDHEEAPDDGLSVEGGSEEEGEGTDGQAAGAGGAVASPDNFGSMDDDEADDLLGM